MDALMMLPSGTEIVIRWFNTDLNVSTYHGAVDLGDFDVYAAASSGQLASVYDELIAWAGISEEDAIRSHTPQSGED